MRVILSPAYVLAWDQSRNGTEYELNLAPGDGRRLTLDEIKAAEKTGAAGTASGSGSGSGESAADKAKRESCSVRMRR